ncbi:unnamed protein product [Tenebrio molitor]|nr:unnamed protein product [Tenebrio molitor]
MNLSQLDNISVGKIITLVTRDVNEFDIYILKATYFLSDSLRFLITCYVIYVEIGYLVAVLVGLFCTIMLIQVLLAKILASMKIKTLKETDIRYQATKEMLDAIATIKCYIWGDSYTKKVSKVRTKEVCLIYKIYLLLYAKFAISETILNASTYVFITSSIWLGNQIKVETIFFLITSMQSLDVAFKRGIPRGMHEMIKIRAILRRIRKVLRTVDAQSPSTSKNQDKVPAKIILSNIYVHSKDRKILENVNFEICNGLTVISGSTASGKSLLLQVILGEYESVAGRLSVNGGISYASQQPWLFASTIRQNILFGTNYDEERYLRVLRMCALLHDLQSLPGGDGFIVADRGVNLSKGQQSRINLARAVYRDSEIYLLDDCLSNLDFLVADYIFEKCIKEFLKDKLVILVTQNPRHIAGADNVIILNEQTAKLLSNSSRNLLQQETKSSSTAWKEDNCKENEDVTEEDAHESTNLLSESKLEKNIYEERVMPGRINLGSYKKFIAHGGGSVTFIITCIVFGVVLISKSSFQKLENNWIGTEQQILNYTIHNNTNDGYKNAIQKRHQMIYIFPIILITLAMMSFLRAAIFYLLARKASLSLHRLLFEKIVNASAKFFSKHYIGNILNRFSEDLLYVDERVPFSMYMILEAFADTIGIMILMASVNITFLTISLVFSTLPVAITIFCLKTGRILKQLEISTRSAFIGHVNATTGGLPIIRSAKVENILINDFDKHQNLYTSASYLYVCWFRALIFIVHTSFLFFTSAILIQFMIVDRDISAAHVGLVLSQAAIFKKSLQVLFRRGIRIETEITSIERILEYTKQDQEHRDGVLVEGWPQQGEIKFNNVYLSYDSDNYVLHDLNFTVKPQETIAIVGRTAAGKSSIISTILRLHKFEGKIFIDGVDIATLPLETLRSNVSVISQDPALFTGTVRENIDLTGKYTDAEIWNALKTVKLEMLFSSLDHRISTVESNLSLGQKQLLCLARAIIRKSKILIMDEVTASVDQKTENMIHRIVLEELAYCTVIMITHKLDYVLQYDKVMVLDNGSVVEFDHPSLLLENVNGLFHKIFKKAN